MRRGEVVYAEPDPVLVGHEQAGRRPVLVVSTNEAMAAMPSPVIVVPLTTRERGWPTHVPMTGDLPGLARPSWALVEQVRAIDTRRFGRSLGQADAETMRAVAQVLARLTGMDELT